MNILKPSLVAILLTVNAGCATGRTPPASPVSDRPVPSDVVDIRDIWSEAGLDRTRIAEQGLDAAQMVAPKKIRTEPPVYPDEARSAGIGGTVTLECVIDVDGVPLDCQEKAGPYPLRGAARDAVTRWRWQPLTVAGVPRPALVRLTVTFALR